MGRIEIYDRKTKQVVDTIDCGLERAAGGVTGAGRSIAIRSSARAGAGALRKMRRVTQRIRKNAAKAETTLTRVMLLTSWSLLGFPKTLLEFQRMLPTDGACTEFVLSLRWPKGLFCPACGS